MSDTADQPPRAYEQEPSGPVTELEPESEPESEDERRRRRWERRRRAARSARRVLARSGIQSTIRQRLALLDAAGDVYDLDESVDAYGDGVVAALETEVARLLGKEAAAFFPTGTMAQQVALRCWPDVPGTRPWPCTARPTRRCTNAPRSARSVDCARSG